MKYPNGVKQNVTKITTYGNRGMNLEEDINVSNEYYADNNIAFVYKKPTPIQITKVEYPAKNKPIIKEAFFKAPSTTDYNGVYNGKYIDFEAKETNNKNYFPLDNIHKHQIKHIRNVINSKGICFLIVRFVKMSQTFLLDGKDFLQYIDNNERKSVPLSYFQEKGYLLEEKYVPRIDYIKIIDLIS